MKNLAPSAFDPYEIFQNIVESKRGARRSRLELLVHPVGNQFERYSASVGRLESILQGVFTEEEKEDLEDCYLVKTIPLGKLLADIVYSQPVAVQGQCQYCGISSPTSFDHYLPKSLYPEFSAYSLNILPCCHTCNQKKKNTFLRNGRRQLINLYFDQLPKMPYLNANIQYYNDIPVAIYTLEKPEGLLELDFELIQAHYECLGLLQRFRNKSPEILSETRSIIQTHLSTSSTERVQDYLLAEAKRLIEIFSCNYWKAVLHLAMAKDNIFVDSCRLN